MDDERQGSRHLSWMQGEVLDAERHARKGVVMRQSGRKPGQT